MALAGFAPSVPMKRGVRGPTPMEFKKNYNSLVANQCLQGLIFHFGKSM